MASPQVENGYLRIANTLWDALTAYRLPGEQEQCLKVIIRKTYGWGKRSDSIPLSQFVQMTGINKQNIIRALKGLLSKKIISVIKKDNKRPHVYEINKDFTRWLPLSKKIMLSKKIISVIKKDNKPLSKKSTSKDTTKDNNKRQYRDFVFLKESEHKKLTEKYGKQRVEIMLDTLDNYIGANPKKRDKYTDHYRTILSWVVGEVLGKMPMGTRGANKAICEGCGKETGAILSSGYHEECEPESFRGGG